MSFCEKGALNNCLILSSSCLFSQKKYIKPNINISGNREIIDLNNFAYINGCLKIWSPKKTDSLFSHKLVNGDFTPTKKYLEYMLKIWTSKIEGIQSLPSAEALLKEVKLYEYILPIEDRMSIRESRFYIEPDSYPYHHFNLSTIEKYAEALKQSFK